jgi:probable phosphoglycerate mutase
LTRFLLVRHATCDPVGVAIAGRAPGVSLNERGKEEAKRVARFIGAEHVEAVYTSPLARARETADVIARMHGTVARVNDAFSEIDFGAWTGRTLHELDADDAWRRFNTFRSGTPVPDGELLADAQLRAVRGLIALREAHPGATVVVVSHADVLRAALAYFLGMPIDLMQRFEISPASVSTLALEQWGATVTGVNAIPRAC